MIALIKSILALFLKPAQPVAKPVPVQPDPPKPDPVIVPVPSKPVIVTPSVITVGLDYQLSPHFTFGMLTKTEHRDWIDINRAEAQKYVDNLAKLANQVLEPVYTLMGSLFVTSCFRCPGLNATIGGSTTSQHCDAEACDMEFQGATEGAPLKAAFNKIAFSNIQYSQVIVEFDQWIHIGRIDLTLHPGKKLQKLVASTVKQPDGSSKTVYTTVTKPL